MRLWRKAKPTPEAPSRRGHKIAFIGGTECEGRIRAQRVRLISLLRGVVIAIAGVDGWLPNPPAPAKKHADRNQPQQSMPAKVRGVMSSILMTCAREQIHTLPHYVHLIGLTQVQQSSAIDNQGKTNDVN